MNVIAHSLQKLFARRSRACKSKPPKASATSAFRFLGFICFVSFFWGRILPPKNPEGGLTMPDERVPHDMHIIALTKFHERVGGAPIVALWALFRMNQRPFQVVLGRNVVKLLNDQCPVSFDLLRRPTAESESARWAPRNAAIYSRADGEVILESHLEGGSVAGLSHGTVAHHPADEQTAEDDLVLAIIVHFMSSLLHGMP
jgi:hypothetical protein